MHYHGLAILHLGFALCGNSGNLTADLAMDSANGIIARLSCFKLYLKLAIDITGIHSVLIHPGHSRHAEQGQIRLLAFLDKAKNTPQTVPRPR